MVIAGIVLYNPNINRLIENVKAIENQVKMVLLVDNGSNNIDLVYSAFRRDNSIMIICNGKNLGIARALNIIMDYGEKKGAEWVLTLDQDSVCPPQIVSELLNYSYLPRIGIICPLIKDRSFGILDKSQEKYIYVDTCITSASLTNVVAWKEVKGFDDTMFIDGVDTDFCYSLKKNGYKIIQVRDVELLHEIGHNSKIVDFLGHKQVVFNHSAFRYYHICRNIIYKQRKHRKYLPSPYRGLITVLYRWLLIILYESDKVNKTKAIYKGLIDGFRMDINYNNYIK